ncbi:MAG TPA: Na+/H+ antiporter [Solirubrobacteraceae bacterium]
MFLASSTDLELLAVLGAITLLLLAAYRTRVPYPILLVIGGAAIGFVPGMPDTTLEPELVLLIFLPPLLYAAAFFSSLRDLRDDASAISLLAIGCVLFTTAGVAVVAHTVVPGMSWEVALTLGAILSPTDAIAATAIASRVGAPRRFVTIVEGESLVNDATALIVYKVALTALVSGSFNAFEAGGEFVMNAIAGILIGLAVGYAIAALRSLIDDAPTEISISLVTPFFAYLPAEAAGVSAVLAAVTAGIYLGWHSPRLITPATRIQAFSVWEILTFVLNAALFVLVGLALPDVIDGISGSYSTGELVWYGAAVSLAVVAARFLWIFPMTLLPGRLMAHMRGSDRFRNWRLPFAVAFTGMRGGVSLAAALALPFTLDDGGALPFRDLVIFLTYAVILVTLVLQGLSLPWLMRALRLEEEPDLDVESEARMRAAWAALEALDKYEHAEWTREETVGRMRALYEYRIRRFNARLDPDGDDEIEAGSLAYQRLRRKVLEAERAEIIRMRNRGIINDEVMRRIERDLDLEDARLEI